MNKFRLALLLGVFVITWACNATPIPPSPSGRPTTTAEATTQSTRLPTDTPKPTVPPTPPPTDTPEPSPTPAYPLAFEPAECPEFISRGISEGYDYEFGYLVVPEDRSQPQGRQVRLPVLVFKSTSDNPASDPVIYLHGGPGFGIFLHTDAYLDVLGDDILATRDFILYQQRGGLLAEPELGCPDFRTTMGIDYPALLWELAGQELSYEERSARLAEFWLNCRNEMSDRGINLEMYNSATNAADANDLRIALGYEQVNYIGSSYGTRVALELLRDYSQGIRSVILDAAYPPQVAWYSAYVPNRQHALEKLFAACAADAHCKEKYPDLEEAFYRAIEMLDADPAVIEGLRGPVIVDGAAFINLVFESLDSKNKISVLPGLIHMVAKEGIHPSLHLGFISQITGPFDSSLPVVYATRCRERAPFDSLEQTAAASAELPFPLSEWYLFRVAPQIAVCESWGIAPADPVESEPVLSDLPALVLVGQFDAKTPPEWARLTAENLGNSFVYEFPGIGHSPMTQSLCASDIALQFLAAPTIEPDTSCIEEMSGSEFW
jgi:pimeloyl-ACP methyl ester carboxylesterase